MTSAVAGPLWHVTMSVSGASAPPEQLAMALRRLCELDPMNVGARYAADNAELQFWDEGPELRVVAEAAVAWWDGVREDAGLPEWSLTGLEVMERHLWQVRSRRPRPVIAPGSVALLA